MIRVETTNQHPPVGVSSDRWFLSISLQKAPLGGCKMIQKDSEPKMTSSDS